MIMPERGKSLTHEHILAVIATELKRNCRTGVVRILDVGCGNGELISYLHKTCRSMYPDIVFEIHGMDVSDHGVQSNDFLSYAIDALTGNYPGLDWKERIQSVASKDPWPFPDEYLDIIITNQVAEHVREHALFFREIHRTLKQGGFSVNLFPLKQYIFEGHLWLPFVHRIQDHDMRYHYIRFLSLLGLGKYKAHRRDFKMNLDQYSEIHSDYIVFMTNYLSKKEVFAHAKSAMLRVSFRYTQEFYYRKLRNISGLSPRFIYNGERNAFIDWLFFNTLKYVSSITLFIEKKQTYVVPG